ncbi:MAG TPA: DISARM system helicase DrmA [Polyangiaceae bacterium]|nr:DISARM system helicase DrmA [Polyangiaceae bacterium]
MPSNPHLLARAHLVRALEADLVGPFTLEPSSTETLTLAPSRWYLTGFLAPQYAKPLEEHTEEDELGVGDDEDEPDGAAPDAPPKGPRMFPASIGLSVLLPPSKQPDAVKVSVAYALYRAAPEDAANDSKRRSGAKKLRWTRVPQPTLEVELPLEAARLKLGHEVAPGLWLEGHLALANTPGLHAATRALSLFLVNRRPLVEGRQFDESCLFQVRLELRHAGGLVARPNRRDESSEDEDEKVVDLQFREHCEWAVGHGVAVDALTEAGSVVGACTTWLPQSVVPRVDTLEIQSVTTSMDALAEQLSGEALRGKLWPLAEHYAAWIVQQSQLPLQAPGAPASAQREATREMLLYRAGDATRRIAAGIELLASDEEAREAFRLANRVMADAARQRSPARYATEVPAWRLFQLAFLLLNLESISNPHSDERPNVELLFFPTGGGKTEAYLGIIAFALGLRRLRGRPRVDAGLGVAVLLRYTLRLLTLDQLGRAATLISALELQRRKHPERLGKERFAIGLWVGRGATANTLDQALEEIRAYRAGRGPLPFPLPGCPWCRTPLGPQCLTTEPSKKPERVLVGCANIECPFASSNHAEGIPVLFVDEQIYRERPCFVVATVDKLAMLPWRGRTTALFGRVHSRVGKECYGVMDSAAPSRASTPLPEGLLPPELIVQDELHLISGPLGTMVGLYETAVEELASRSLNGKRVVPKIIASTATVRRAHQQVRSLFGRNGMQVFPPAGVDDSETFFARVDRHNPGRLYLGVAAPGRAMKTLLIRTYISLLGAAQHVFQDPAVPREVADAYMTLVGYFNSLRELGGMRRLLEDEIRHRVAKDEHERVPFGFAGVNPWVRQRDIKCEPVELTSRESTASIASAKRNLETAHPAEGQIDVALASNMISVGLDIDRLGLMVIAGQPKTTSEYIQSSSRVGRDNRRPGLVVTVFNAFRARDRSHYERFSAYHQSFYRFIEASSVTPFSPPALERGLAGVLVTMTRLGNAALTPAHAVTNLETIRTEALSAVRCIAGKAANERESCSPADAERISGEILRIGQSMIDAWAEAVGPGAEGGATCYSNLDKLKGTPLLFTSLDADAPEGNGPRSKFAAGTSRRDVEASVHLWKNKQRLYAPEDDDGR